LGGYGLVGQAVARRLLREEPARMILLSLQRAEAEEAVEVLRREAGAPAARGQAVALEAAWGDVFTFADVKDEPRRALFARPGHRTRLIQSLTEPLSEAAASEYFLHQLVTNARPDIIVDAVNTATGIAYQDIYRTSRQAWEALLSGGELR